MSLAGPARPTRWLPILVLMVGGACVATLAGVSIATRAAQAHDDALTLALQEARLGLYRSHLGLEEKLAGDAIAAGSIVSDLDLAAGALSRLSSDSQPATSSRPLAAAQGHLGELRGATGDRLEGFDQGEASAPGSPTEAAYDDLFAVLQGDLDRLAAAFSSHRLEHQQGAHRVLAAALSLWSMATLLATLVLWRREIRRGTTEAALAESRRQLLRAQRMEAVGRLAGGIAHDVNNSLAAIRAHCELVLRKEVSRPKLEEKMRAVVDTVLRASSLVERLLTFARRQPSKPERVLLNDAVEEIDRVLRGTLPDDVDFSLDLAPDLWPVEIDLAQLDQVLANLFVNARDALRGKGRIAITTCNQAVPRGPDRVRLSVSDDGIGMPPEILEKIFDPFFTTKEAHGASGLGLATVWAIVEQAGGQIEVESTVGEGSTFHLLLPRCSTSGAVRLRQRQSASSVNPGARILLVEDDSAVASAVREILDSLGYLVTLAADGPTAMAVVAAAAPPFDLVITDVRLPGISGPELIAQLRALAPVRALFMSGFTDRIALRGISSQNDAFFLKKPFSAEGLVRMVRQLLDRREEPVAAPPG